MRHSQNFDKIDSFLNCFKYLYSRQLNCTVSEWVIKEGIPGILHQIYKSTGGVNIYWRCQKLAWLGKNGGSNKNG